MRRRRASAGARSRAGDCIGRIREQAPDLTDDEIDEIVSELQRTLDARKAEAKLDSLDRDLLNRADELAREYREAVQIERRNRLLNIKRNAELSYFAVKK